MSNSSTAIKQPQQAQKKAVKKAVKHVAKKSSYSHPTLIKRLKVTTTSAQHLMERSFERLESALFTLDVSLLFSDRIPIIEKYKKATDQAYAALKDELTHALQNAQTLAKNNGISHDVTYRGVKSYTWKLRTPRAMTFLNLVALLDQLIICVDTIWMNDADLVGGNKARLDHHHQWYRRISRFFNEIINFRNAQYKASSAHKTASKEESKQDKQGQNVELKTEQPTTQTTEEAGTEEEPDALPTTAPA